MYIAQLYAKMIERSNGAKTPDSVPEMWRNDVIEILKKDCYYKADLTKEQTEEV